MILLTSGRGAGDLAGKWRTARWLRTRKFDCAILLQNAFEAALIAWLAGIPRRIGYDRDRRGWLLSDPVPLPAPGEIPRHERFYYLELLRRAGILEGVWPADPIRFSNVEPLRTAGAEALRGAGLKAPVIGVSPGAAFGSAKRWPGSSFAEAAARLAHELQGSVAVFGSGQEKALCEEVAGQIRERNITVRNFAGQTTLRAFIELAAGCGLYLTNDSGAMHVAYALGIPTVAVFGSTDEFATGPAGPSCTVVREKVECSPCLLRECPIDHRCMRRVAADRVVEAALALVRKAG